MRRHGRVRWGVLCAFLLVASASAGEGRLVMVAPGAGKDVLSPLAAALRDADGPEPLLGAALLKTVKTLKLKDKELGNEARMAKVAQALGASAFLIARPQGRGKDAALGVTLYALDARARWSTSVKLQKGRVSEAAARHLAGDVKAQLAQSAQPAPKPEEGPAIEPPQAMSPPAPVAEAPKPLAPAEPPKPVEPEAGAPPAVATVKEPERPAPAVAEDLREETAVVTARPEKKAARAGSVAIPLLEVAVGGAALWRSHEFCPGVTRCGQKVINPAAPIRYITERPYVGPAVRATMFPLARWESPLRGLGLTGGYSRGFLQTAVTDASGQAVSLPTYDESYSAEVVYRYALRLGWGDASVGVRGGILGRSFVLPANVAITESRRTLSPVFGAELAVPIWDPHVRLEVSARYAPLPLPGAAEREAYGGDTVTSAGLLATAGLSGDFEDGWGYALMGEFTGFSDTFIGTGQRANGGAAHEEYLGVVGLVRYRF